MFGAGRGIRPRRALTALAATALAAATIAACGSSTSTSLSPSALLKQTFSSSSQVQSGKLNFAITLTPNGSSTVSQPVGLSFGGPFETLGKGKVPASDFQVAISAFGSSIKIGLLSTGTQGFVTLDGASYQLPEATFRQLASSFSPVTSAGSGSSALGQLGIDPQKWMVNPTIAGHDTLDGTDTTHVKAGVNLGAMLADLGTLLQKAPAGLAGVGNVSNLSPSDLARLASQIRNPSVDVWTGTADKLLRKLSVAMTLAVTGKDSAALGGITSALINLTISYASVNQHQTIAAPANPRPYAEFQQKMTSFLGQLTGSNGAAGAGTSPSTTSSPTTTSSALSAYAQCIQAAGSDVAKMQPCASLLTKK